MSLTAQQANGNALADLIGAAGSGTALFAVAVLFVAVAFVLAVLLFWRHRTAEDVRRIVQGIEDLRSGPARARPELPPGSPLGAVSDAIHRLGAQLQGSRSDVESAAERWRTLTDATRDTAIVTTDTDGDIRSFSTGASRLLGWDEEEVLARSASMLFEAVAYKDLLPQLARRSLRTQGVTTRSTLMRRDGSGLPAELSVRLMLGANSQPSGFMMVIRDITGQLRMETELRTSEQRYRGLVEGLAEGVMIVRDGAVAYVNPAAIELWGGDSDELLGTSWRSHIETSDVLVVQAAIQMIESGQSSSETTRCTVVDLTGKRLAWVRIEARPVEFDGAPAILLLIQDETAERRIGDELRRNEARLDSVLEATSDGILVLSEDRESGMVRMTNRAFAEMMRIPIEDLLGASEDRLLRLLHERGNGVEAVAIAISSEASTGPQETISLGGPSPKEIQVSVSRLVGAAGEGLGRIVACRDLTEQRRSERELQAQADSLQLSKVELEQSHRKLNEVNARLEARGAELNQLNQELQRLDQMKSDFLGNVSHELQTPLVSIRGYTEMILKERLGPISEEQRKGLSLSLRNIDRLISMIDNLMAFSRADPGLGELSLSRFPLQPVVDEAVDVLQERIAAKQLQVTLGLNGDDLTIQADRDKILQVFINLLSNAVAYNRPSGSIEITAGVGETSQATVRVKDTGVGIAEEAQGRIFDRHFRARQTGAVDAEGSGIGLAIVRDILRLHGCSIGVESTEGQGSVFTFTLPLAREEAERERAEDPPGPRPIDEPVTDPPEQSAPTDTPPPPSAEDSPGAAPRPRLRIIRRSESKG